MLSGGSGAFLRCRGVAVNRRRAKRDRQRFAVSAIHFRLCGRCLRCRSFCHVEAGFTCAALLARAALAAGALTLGSPTWAQYACTVTSTDSTCTNSGSAPGGELNSAGGPEQNSTTTNSGNSGTIITQTTGGGNASTTNFRMLGGDVFTVTDGGGNAVTTNFGTISGGIATDTFAGGNAAATNFGTVSGGIFTYTNAAAGNATTTNFGAVSGGITTETSDPGGNAATTNFGAVSGGILTYANAAGNATTTNFGTVSGGVFTYTIAGGNATTTNFGTVMGGIATDTFAGGNATTANFGTVSGGVLMEAFGGSSTLTNRGVIANTGGPAIAFIGGPDTLTNVAGSRVIGAIDLVGIHDTVNFFGGNWLFTFNTLAGATINTGGAPFVVASNQVAALDPTAFALADRSLMNFTGEISQTLQGRFNGMAAGAAGPGSMSFAASPSAVAEQAQTTFGSIPSVAVAYASDAEPMFTKAAPAGKAAPVPYYDTTIWASGFGGGRWQEANGPILSATDTAFGAALGVDRTFGSNVRLGGFVGGGGGQEAIAGKVQTINTDYYYGGGYGRFDWMTHYLEFALYGGSMTNSSTRGIANNTVPTGFETASASSGGWFISPQLLYGVRIPVMDFVVTPRVMIRYLGAALDGYSETGSSQNLTVGARPINDLEQRLEVELIHTAPVAFGGTLKATANFGAIRVERLGDSTINVVLLGQNLAFVTPGAATAFGGVAGTGIEYRPTAHWEVFASGEGTIMSDKSVTGIIEGGVRAQF